MCVSKSSPHIPDPKTKLALKGSMCVSKSSPHIPDPKTKLALKLLMISLGEQIPEQNFLNKKCPN